MPRLLREKRVRLLHWLLGLVLLAIALQLLTAAELFYLKFGFTPESIQAAFLGDPERFVAPRTVEGLLKTTVPHLLAIPAVGIFLLHLLSCTPRCRGLLAGLFFSGALLDLSANYLILLSPLFVWVKLVGFFLLMAGASGALGVLLSQMGLTGRQKVT